MLSNTTPFSTYEPLFGVIELGEHTIDRWGCRWVITNYVMFLRWILDDKLKMRPKKSTNEKLSYKASKVARNLSIPLTFKGESSAF